MKKILIKAPKKFNSKKQELSIFIKKYNPVFLIEKFTGRKLNKNIVLQHKDLKMEARFNKSIIYVDFNNKSSYIWLCICHELSHIVLEDSAWYKDKDIYKFVKNRKKIVSSYSFVGAVEQAFAILLQAACENRANIRKLRWSYWELTFDYMKVKNIGKSLWRSWLFYLKNISRYKNIDKWILEQFEKGRI